MFSGIPIILVAFSQSTICQNLYSSFYTFSKVLTASEYRWRIWPVVKLQLLAVNGIMRPLVESLIVILHYSFNLTGNKGKTVLIAHNEVNLYSKKKKNKHERDFVLQVRCRNLNNSCDKISTLRGTKAVTNISWDKIATKKIWQSLCNLQDLVYFETSDITKISWYSACKRQMPQKPHGCKEYSQYMFDK